MRFTLAATSIIALALFASMLQAQSPPYGGYNPAPPYYSTGPYQGTMMACSNFTLKQGSTVLINNASSAATTPYHTYFPTPVGNMVPGAAHTIDVTCTGSGSTYPTYATAWIDYNNDGVFNTTAPEYLGASPTSGAGTVVTISFTASAAYGGVKRLRMRTNYSTPATHPTTTFSYGESEDYLVNLGFAISTSSPLPTGAQSTAYSTDIVAQNGTTPYVWQGSPTYLISGSLPAGLSASVVGSPAPVLRISGTPTGTGTSNFTVSVTDAASNNSTKAFQITIFPPPATMPFNDDFETDKGWQRAGLWERDVCQAYTGTGPNRTEPGTDHSSSTTTNRILGHNIGADYANSMGATEWATSPPINCQPATNVRLRFWRWLGCSPNDVAQIQATNNGSTWSNVWTAISGATVNDTAWTSVFYDITAIAAGNSVVQIRFGMGTTDASIVNVGWCIDDLVLEQPGQDMVLQTGSTSGPTFTDGQTTPWGARDFGIVGVSQSSAPLDIWITNNGPTNINFTNALSPPAAITKTGLNPTDFIINASAMANPLPPGQSTSFTITFWRSTAGSSSATINLFHNALYSGSSPYEINVIASAQVPNPIIQVNLGSATGPQINASDPATLANQRDFGNQNVGSTSAPITLFVTNAGTGTLNVGAPYRQGNWWNQYVVNSAGMVGSLLPGQSTSFTISFLPTSIGIKDAEVDIPFSGGSQLSPFIVPVLGTGTSASGGATLEVHDGLVTGPQLPYNDPASTGSYRDFGNQLVGGQTAAKTFTIENTGGAAMTLSVPVLGGTNPTEFTLSTTGFLTSLNSGQTTSFTVAFGPTSVGVKLATVTFTHNDTTVTSPFIVNLRGNGVTTAPAIQVRENGPGGALLANPAPATGILDFGNQDLNAGPTAVATIHVTNGGTAALTLGIPSFSAPTTEFQLQVTGFAGTVAPAGTATFTITFDPTVVGTHTAIVEFTHNDATAGTPFVLNLTGDAVLNAPQLEVREVSTIGPIVQSGDPALGTGRDCGSIGVTAGGTIPVVVVIMNTGTQNLNLGAPTLGGNNAADFQLDLSGMSMSVAPGANTQFNVRFDPNLAGIKDCTVQFTHDDPAQTNPYVLNFVGTGTDPNAVLITTPSLPAAIPDMMYGPMQIDAIQGTAPYIWSIYSGNLPGGLGLSTAGVLSGTPSGFGGTFNVIIRVQDQTGATNERQYTIVVSGDLSGRGKAKDGGCAVQGGSTGLLALIAALGMAVAAMRLARNRQ